ncbi:hypothetical protein ACFXTN_024985 [Malus domestica]
MSVLSQFFTSAVNLQKPNNLKLSQKTHRFTRLSSPISDAPTVTFPSLPKLEPECACLLPGRHHQSVTSMADFQFNVSAPLISAHDQLGIWMVLFAIGAFGIWSEKNTKIGSALSGALISTLIGLAASNLGIISSNSSAYLIVLEFLLPLAVPLAVPLLQLLCSFSYYRERKMRDSE